LLATTARGSTPLVSDAAGEALGTAVLQPRTATPPQLVSLSGRRFCRRGLFESSPSRPDSNGARHLSAPHHPPFGVFLRRARRRRQGGAGGVLRTQAGHRSDGSHDDEPDDQPGRESSCLGARTQRCPDDAPRPHPNEAGSRGGIGPQLRKWTPKSSHCVKAATPTRRSLAGWSWGAPLMPTEVSCARSEVTTAPSAVNSSKTRKHAWTDSSNGSATGMPQSRARSNDVCSA
jgi:hypothetical protein